MPRGMNGAKLEELARLCWPSVDALLQGLLSARY